MCINGGTCVHRYTKYKFLNLWLGEGDNTNDDANDKDAQWTKCESSLVDNSNPLRPVWLIQTKEFYPTLVSQPKPTN